MWEKQIKWQRLKKKLKNSPLSKRCGHLPTSCAKNIEAAEYKHIVNYKTINGVKLISLITGYNEVAIYTPTMLINSDDDGGYENDL